MTIFKSVNYYKYHVRDFIHWRFHKHFWEIAGVNGDGKCDCPSYGELIKWKNFKVCRVCSLHCELTYKNW